MSQNHRPHPLYTVTGQPLIFTISIVKIDSRTQPFCLCQYVQNGLSYSGKETWPKLCLKRHQANSGVRSLGTNKHQLLHRIPSVPTFTNLQYKSWGARLCINVFEIEVEWLSIQKFPANMLMLLKSWSISSVNVIATLTCTPSLHLSSYITNHYCLYIVSFAI